MQLRRAMQGAGHNEGYWKLVSDQSLSGRLARFIY